MAMSRKKTVSEEKSLSSGVFVHEEVTRMRVAAHSSGPLGEVCCFPEF